MNVSNPVGTIHKVRTLSEGIKAKKRTRGRERLKITKSERTYVMDAALL